MVLEICNLLLRTALVNGRAGGDRRLGQRVLQSGHLVVVSSLLSTQPLFSSIQLLLHSGDMTLQAVDFLRGFQVKTLSVVGERNRGQWCEKGCRGIGTHRSWSAVVWCATIALRVSKSARAASLSD